MKNRLFFVFALLPGCAAWTVGEPEVMELGEGKFYISAKTGPWVVEQPEKVAKIFSAKANEVCAGKSYTESEVHERTAVYHDKYVLWSNGTITIKEGIVECRSARQRLPL